MKNNAYVKYDFKKGFILDEAKLRKINEIIRKRLEELELEEELEFEMFRADSYCIICDNIESIRG